VWLHIKCEEDRTKTAVATSRAIGTRLDKHFNLFYICPMPLIALDRKLQLAYFLIRTRSTIIRPPDLCLIGGRRVYRDRIYILYLFVSYTLRARWTELRQNRPHDRKWVRFDLKTHVRNQGYHPPTNREPKTTCFRGFRNLMATVTAIFERNISYTIGKVRWKLQRVSYMSQNVMNFGPQTA